MYDESSSTDGNKPSSAKLASPETDLPFFVSGDGFPLAYDEPLYPHVNKPSPTINPRLSLVQHPKWKGSHRPTLVSQVDSDEYPIPPTFPFKHLVSIATPTGAKTHPVALTGKPLPHTLSRRWVIPAEDRITSDSASSTDTASTTTSSTSTTSSAPAFTQPIHSSVHGTPITISASDFEMSITLSDRESTSTTTTSTSAAPSIDTDLPPFVHPSSGLPPLVGVPYGIPIPPGLADPYMITDSETTSTTTTSTSAFPSIDTGLPSSCGGRVPLYTAIPHMITKTESSSITTTSTITLPAIETGLPLTKELPYGPGPEVTEFYTNSNVESTSTTTLTTTATSHGGFFTNVPLSMPPALPIPIIEDPFTISNTESASTATPPATTTQASWWPKGFGHGPECGLFFPCPWTSTLTMPSPATATSSSDSHGWPKEYGLGPVCGSDHGLPCPWEATSTTTPSAITTSSSNPTEAQEVHFECPENVAGYPCPLKDAPTTLSTATRPHRSHHHERPLPFEATAPRFHASQHTPCHKRRGLTRLLTWRKW